MHNRRKIGVVLKPVQIADLAFPTVTLKVAPTLLPAARPSI
jgi:hypothetical protein